MHLCQLRALPSELDVALFIAANAVDYSGYPDCRPAYYRAAAEALHLGSKLGAYPAGRAGESG